MSLFVSRSMHRGWRAINARQVRLVSQAQRKARRGVAPLEGLKFVRTNAKAKFDETLEVSLRLGLDPRKPNQSINALVPLPHGSGKNIKVVVFAEGQDAVNAKEAGADVVGGEELIQDLVAGSLPLDFNRTIATPDLAPMLKKQAARILGPKGLMPNAKTGTITKEVAEAVSTAKKGAVPVKTDRYGIVRAGIGKLSFDDAKLEDNLRAFLINVRDLKPEGAKGRYMLACHISSTMGNSVELFIKACDPTSNYFMIPPSMLEAEAESKA